MCVQFCLQCIYLYNAGKIAWYNRSSIATVNGKYVPNIAGVLNSAAILGWHVPALLGIAHRSYSTSLTGILAKASTTTHTHHSKAAVSY